MNNYDDWEEHWDCINECDARKPPRPTETNKDGGLEPSKPHIKVWKKVDLITLPANIEGTHCFNCEYIAEKKGDIGWCKHEQIHQWVTKRMCCALWDHKKVKRQW